MKYIVKNCPACYNYDGVYGCENNHDEQGRDTYCEMIEDCLMKQIINKCKHADRGLFEGEIYDMFEITYIAEEDEE